MLLLLFLLMDKGHLLHFSIEEDHHISKTRTKLINNPDYTPKLPKHKGVTLFFFKDRIKILIYRLESNVTNKSI